MVRKVRNTAYNWLRWSERYTKTDMLYLAKGGSWLSISHGVVIVVGLITTVAFANLIPPEVFGTYKFVLSLASIIGALSLTGLSTALIRAVARGNEGALKSGFLTSLKWSVGTVVIAAAAALYYYIKEDNVLALSMLIVALFSPLMRGAQLYDSFLSGKKYFKTKAFYNIGRAIFPATILIGVLFLSNNPIAIIAAFFIGNTLITLYYYLRTLRVSRLAREPQKTMTSYSKHVSLMNLLGTTANQIDKILLFHFLGAAQLAIYSFAVVIPEQINGAFKNINVLAFPKFATKSIPEISETIYTKTLKIGVFLVGAVVLYVLLAPLIFDVLFPPYQESIPYSQIYALIILASISILPGTALVSSGAALREQHTINTVHLVVQITSLVILIYLFGIWGAIAARLISRGLKVLLTFYFFRSLSWEKI